MCVYWNKRVYMCHQPYGLFVANYTPNPPHAPTRANQPPYKHTHTHTLSPCRQSSCSIKKTLTGECATKEQITANSRLMLHQSDGRGWVQSPAEPIGDEERGITNRSRSQKVKQLEIEINQSERADRIH